MIMLKHACIIGDHVFGAQVIECEQGGAGLWRVEGNEPERETAREERRARIEKGADF